jgi:hypothetical protein
VVTVENPEATVGSAATVMAHIKSGRTKLQSFISVSLYYLSRNDWLVGVVTGLTIAVMKRQPIQFLYTFKKDAELESSKELQ